MADLIIGLFVVGFILLGVRDGFARSLGGVAAFFLALFAAAGVIEFFANYSAIYKDYLNIATILTFIFIWLIVLIVLELLLGLVLKTIVTITVLGPVDRALGAVVGGGRGMLVAGLILQLLLSLALPVGFKKDMSEAFMTKISVSAYQWAFPIAKRMVPQINKTMKENIINKLHIEVSNEDKPEELKKKLVEVEKAKLMLENQLLKLTRSTSAAAASKGVSTLNEILRSNR
ncbi:MAG: CvpA family protein [Candidatus Margulisbacteria bacterium]|nr:CvpA family protein [Candidatus Margulisiibacteriota bacterium]MBU1617630.1 CvpA family protein [Candidatus Margulisiibacteriota bacterium]MBU1867230.1 CvpA family protein [Candidatus Margulisiibacteriota bacterium]